MATTYCNWNDNEYEWYDDDESGLEELKQDIIDYLKNTPEGNKKLLVTAKEMKCEPSDLEDKETYDEIVENAMDDILDYEIKYHTIDDEYDGYDAFDLASRLMQQGYKDMNNNAAKWD